MIKVALNPAEGGARFMMLNEPTGREELEFASGHSVELTQALARLIRLPRGLGGSGQMSSHLGELSLANRDRLLAAIYVACFGDRIESILNCCACGRPYEFSFSMQELVNELDDPELRSEAAASPRADAAGTFTLEGGIRFRLPRVEDEILASVYDATQAERHILTRCLVEGSADAHRALVDAAMQLVAPLIRTTLDSTCPHCGLHQSVDFDLVSYFTRSFARERPLFTREIHCLASTYSFSFAEIREMPRSVRQELVALVLGQVDRGAA